MGERLGREASPAEAATLWTASYWLLGVRLPAEQAGRLLEGVRAMRESTTYQATLQEGRAEEARRILLRQGGRKFGPPGAEIRTAVEGIADFDRLERLADRVLGASTWGELLKAP